MHLLLYANFLICRHNLCTVCLSVVVETAATSQCTKIRTKSQHRFGLSCEEPNDSLKMWSIRQCFHLLQHRVESKSIFVHSAQLFSFCRFADVTIQLLAVYNNY